MIIDAQNEYATGALRTVDVDSTSAAIATLLGRYRERGGEVVHVLHRTPKGAPVFDAGEGKGEGDEMEGVKARGGEKVRFYLCFSGGRGKGGGKRGWGLTGGRNRSSRNIIRLRSRARICMRICRRRGRRSWF